jgi:hypothetical protein
MFEIFRHHNIEGGGGEQEKAPSHDEMLMKNNIQRGLMDRYAKSHGHESDDPNAQFDYVEWVSKYAPEFARVYDDIQKNEPEILDNWPDHASVVYEEISKRMEAERGDYQAAA